MTAPTNSGISRQKALANTEPSTHDPYAVLGITNAATPEQIHAAYVTMARNYHPDRYAASGLPREVTDYICAMAKRINAAWDILSSSQALA